MNISSRLVSWHSLALVGGLIFAHGIRAQAPPKEQLEQAAAARAILAQFDPKKTEPCKRKLHVIYFTPKGVAPAGGWRERIPRVMEHVRGFYARQMKSYGFGPRTFPLDYGPNKKLVIHLVEGSQPREYYGGTVKSDHALSRRRILEEVRPILAAKGIKLNQELSFIVCNLLVAKDNELSGWMSGATEGYAPLVSTGGHRWGAGFYTDHKFQDPIYLTEKEKTIARLDLGEPKKKLGLLSSMEVGTVAHELGHVFGLVHNYANAAGRGVCLMSYTNFDYGAELRGEGPGAFLSLADVLRLAAHPLFSGTEKQLILPFKVQVRQLKVEPAAKGFQLRGQIASDVQCHTVVAYLRPEGRTGYEQGTSVAIPDEQGRFSLQCRDVGPGKAGELVLVTLFVNGAHHQHEQAYRYVVKADGQADVSDFRMLLAVEPLLAAWRNKDRAAFKAARAWAVKGLAEEDPIVFWSRHIEAAFDDRPLHPEPRMVTTALPEVYLSDCAWFRAKVGYREPTRNHWPNAEDFPAKDYFLSVGSRRYAQGLCAHAPSSYEFILARNWIRCKGVAGLQSWGAGSVVFVIRGDNRELWRSPLVKGARTLPFDVDVLDVWRLQLIVEDGGDGAAFDWAHWLEPKILRGRDEVERIRQAAGKGDLAACTNLGMLYATGVGVAKDGDEAAKWYRKAADLGYAPAQSKLAVLYAEGREVAKNEAEAVRWIRKAADQKHADAQTYLGWMYWNGIGVRKDAKEAVAWFRTAAEKGHADAQLGLSKAYGFGLGVPKNEVVALKWCRLAAKQGNVTAQADLGYMAAKGFGMKQDAFAAVKWLRLAADQGYSVAQRDLGFMYEQGSCVPKSLVEAVRWYLKAAEQGDEEAKKALQRIDGK